MDVIPYVPIIVEATKFLFNEAGKWIDQVRQRSSQTPGEPVFGPSAFALPTLTEQSFAALEVDQRAMAKALSAQYAESNAYVIRSLVEQIQIHHRNLMDHEKVEAEYGVLTPPYVKRAIEREATAIVEKTNRLKGLLEQVYEREIDYV